MPPSLNPKLHLFGRSIAPQHLLLADGLGALLSAMLLGIVLASWPEVFGMPAPVVYSLSAVAGAMALCSLAGYLWAGPGWPRHLRLVAGINIVYMIATLVLIAYYHSSLSVWGLLYFSGELLIITLLVLAEYRLLRTANPSTS